MGIFDDEMVVAIRHISGGSEAKWMKRRLVCTFSTPFAEMVKRSGHDSTKKIAKKTYEIFLSGRHAPSARVDWGNRACQSGRDAAEKVRV